MAIRIIEEVVPGGHGSGLVVGGLCRYNRRLILCCLFAVHKSGALHQI